MRVLLDTHTLLWWAAQSSKLSELARQTISDSENDVYLSIVSAWEMQIKAQLGKLRLHRPLADLFEEQRDRNGFRMLPVTLEHIYALDRLPLHHRDPFDRLLLAQALAEGLDILSHDEHFRAYPVSIVW